MIVCFKCSKIYTPSQYSAEVVFEVSCFRFGVFFIRSASVDTSKSELTILNVSNSFELEIISGIEFQSLIFYCSNNLEHGEAINTRSCQISSSVTLFNASHLSCSHMMFVHKVKSWHAS